MRIESALALIIVFSLPALGCVSQQARDHANLLAAYTDKVRGDAERIRSFRDTLAKARRDNMQLLERNTLELQQETARYVTAWKVAGDKDRVALFDGVLTATSEVAEQRRETRALLAKQKQARAGTTTLFEARSAKLREAAKALSAVGEKPNFKAQVKFLVAFLEDVSKSIDEADADAMKEAESGTNEAESENPTEEPK